MNINMKSKKFIIIAVSIFVLLVAGCVILLIFGRKEEYRNIQIYSIEGTAEVERGGIGKVEAYEGMMMQSGDTVYTDKDSCLYFKMDEDKYALLEPESTVRIEFSGTSADSKTVFHLETGSLVSRLDNKLSSDSVYEVNTPNSTMAVRGTVFRIEVTYDENGVSYTNVYIFEGTVECQLIFPDGSKDEEIKQAEGGMKIRIRGDDTISEYILNGGTVDYGELPAEVLKFLRIAIEESIELSISKEKIDALIAQKNVTAEEQEHTGQKNVTAEEHEHTGGTATCVSPAVCTVEGCGEAYGEENAANHTGGTEIRGAKEATCSTVGYTGDTYCEDCGVKTADGREIPKLTTHTGGTATCKDQAVCTVCNESYGEKNADNHTGDTEVRDVKDATCGAVGYTGDTYCKGCGVKIADGEEIPKLTTHTGGTATCKEPAVCAVCGGSYGEKDAANHTGDTETRDEKDATCCETGYTGDTYCEGCGEKIASGQTIDATGKHPAAACGAVGHHAHDGKSHAPASCGIGGHCTSDGGYHSGPAECMIPNHYACDGKDHNDDLVCLTQEEKDSLVNISVTIIDPGIGWKYTIGNITVTEENFENFDGMDSGGGFGMMFRMPPNSSCTITAYNDQKVYIATMGINEQISADITITEDSLTDGVLLVTIS